MGLLMSHTEEDTVTLLGYCGQKWPVWFDVGECVLLDPADSAQGGFGPAPHCQQHLFPELGGEAASRALPPA